MDDLVQEAQRKALEGKEQLIYGITCRLLELGYAPGSAQIGLVPPNSILAHISDHYAMTPMTLDGEAIDLRWDEVRQEGEYLHQSIIRYGQAVKAQLDIRYHAG